MVDWVEKIPSPGHRILDSPTNSDMESGLTESLAERSPNNRSYGVFVGDLTYTAEV